MYVFCPYLFPSNSPKYIEFEKGGFSNFFFNFFRSLSKYRLFSGLWFGDDKPFFSTFFKPFVDKVCAAQVHGKNHKVQVIICGVSFTVKARYVSTYWAIWFRAFNSYSEFHTSSTAISPAFLLHYLLL